MIRKRAWAAAAAVTGLGFFLWVWLEPGGARLAADFSDGATIVLSAAAGVSCLRAGRAYTGRVRAGWSMLGAGMFCWSAGEVVWAWYEVILGNPDVPYPSLADVGFLGLVPLALAGMAALVTVERNPVRSLLDGLIISGSLLYVSWATVLGPAFRGGDQTPLAFGVDLAYPIGDIATATMVFVLLVHSGRRRRAPLVLVGCGTLALAVADSGFLYLSQLDGYSSGNLIDTGWVVGFLLIGLAGVWARACADAPAEARPAGARFALPYVPLAIALVTSLVIQVAHGSVGPFLYVTSTALVVLVVLRQMVSLRDNLVLNGQLEQTVEELRGREEQLRHLAFHDPLTSLANRALFQNRAEHAIAKQERSDLLLGVLYLDLDGFKPVNDLHGHAAGDRLLVILAHRLVECVRPTDTVARLGGDEFAILLEDMATETDALALAQRLVEVLAEPVQVDGTRLQIGASVGLTIHEPGNGGVGELLRNADIAMYAAKMQGKGRCVQYTPEMRTGISAPAA